MKLRRFALLAAPGLLALAMAVTGSGLPAQASAQPAPQTASASAPAVPPEAPKTEAAEGEGAAHEGHHHPEVKLFGKSLDSLAQFGVMSFNFILFAGILFFLLKGALASAFKARTKELEDKLSQAEREKAEAERQIRELEERMAGLSQELEGIMAKAEADAEAEKQRILESAKVEATQILAQTGAEIDAQKRSAEAELRALVSELVVAGAAQRLEARVQGAVAERVLAQAIDHVGGAK